MPLVHLKIPCQRAIIAIVLSGLCFQPHRLLSKILFSLLKIDIQGVPKKNTSGHNFVENQPRELKFCREMSLVSGLAYANFGFDSVPIFVVGPKDVPKIAMQTSSTLAP